VPDRGIRPNKLSKYIINEIVPHSKHIVHRGTLSSGIWCSSRRFDRKLRARNISTQQPLM